MNGNTITPAATPGRSVTWAPARGSLAEPRNARAQARRALSAWGLAEHSDIIEVIVSELVTNAVRHGAGQALTRITWDARRLRVEVHDDGPGRPRRRHATVSDECGRGLAVIDGLLEPYGGSLGVEDDTRGEGKTVYVILCLAADLRSDSASVR